MPIKDEVKEEGTGCATRRELSSRRVCKEKGARREERAGYSASIMKKAVALNLEIGYTAVPSVCGLQ